MLNRRLMTMAGGTIVCALGVGYFMQQATPIGYPSQDAAPQVAASAILEIENITMISSAPETVVETAETIIPAEPEMSVAQVSCTVSMVAKPAPSANVGLTLSAPCHGNERVTLHHNGMMFTQATDDEGLLSVTMPALAEQAVIIAELASGPGAVATTKVSGLDQIDRVVLQWSGNSGFEIHAREFGAGYGEPGHVWSGSQTTLSTSRVARLGDTEQLAPRLAEIYSFDRNEAQTNGTIALSVETEVSAINCGREIAAQTLELSESGGLRTRDLVLSMPNCSAIGDFLVLNNLVEDLKVTAR